MTNNNIDLENSISKNSNDKYSKIQNCLPTFLFDSFENSIDDLEEENEYSTEELSNSKSSDEKNQNDKNNLNINDNDNILSKTSKNISNLNYNPIIVQNYFVRNNLYYNNINYYQFNSINYNNQFPNFIFTYNNKFYNRENLNYKIKNLINNKNNDNQNSVNNNLNLLNNFIQLSNKDFYLYIITQKGSRELQNILNKTSSIYIDKIINKIHNNFPKILIDKYGNYFCQKLIKMSFPYQRIKILKYINKHFIQISLNSFGTHPIQLLIETISTLEEKKLIIKYIINNELILSLDSKGTHILQKLILITNDEERKIINENIIKNISKLIYNSFGICVLIKLINNSKDKNLKEKIVKFIIENNPLNIIQHPYGNYVIQSLFNEHNIIYCKEIINIIIDNIYLLSIKKFSSNVVENCIKFGNENIAKTIYNKIINQGKLSNMLNNTYGNFVIEKLILKLNDEEKNILINDIKKCGKENCLSNNIIDLLYK